LTNKGYLTTVRTTNLSKELLETLKLIENCAGCKDYNLEKCNLDGFPKSINEIRNQLAKLEKEKEEQGKRKIIYELNDKLIKIDDELNQKALCESCKGKKIEGLTDKCDCKLNANNYDKCIQWIPFNEFRNIEYLAKGGFDEVHKAGWIVNIKKEKLY